MDPLCPHGCRWTVICSRREALPLWLPPGFLLQVFGQTPFYTVENAEWDLWPEIPHDLVSEGLTSVAKGLEWGRGS